MFRCNNPIGIHDELLKNEVDAYFRCPDKESFAENIFRLASLRMKNYVGNSKGVLEVFIDRVYAMFDNMPIQNDYID